MDRDEFVQGGIAVLQWSENDGLAEIVANELTCLGYRPVFMQLNSPIPDDTATVLSYGPYGKLLSLVRKWDGLPVAQWPLLAHWNTEGLPDLRLPWPVMRAIASARSWVGRYREGAAGQGSPKSASRRLLALADSRLLRFRWLGDYYYAARKGILAVLADSSAIYTELRRAHGLPTLFAPWGSTPNWYADLQLERDIDVLWMGNRQDRRRRRILAQVRDELKQHGVEIYMADDEENPYIFGEERTQLLNRAKITLNVTRTWYDDNFSRFSLAAPNRSLVISETMLPHCPAYQPGVHYVESAPEELAGAILYYLRHADERARIVESAYQLLTTELTFQNSIAAIMEAAEKVRKFHGLRRGC